MDASDIFRVETVESSAAPSGMPHGQWCRYVIANRSSRVVGRYRGTLAQTRRNAEQLAHSANERTKSGKSTWAPSQRGRRKPPQAVASA